MSDKPITFNSNMVKAILAGNKTQTRRVIKPQPDRDGICFDLSKQNFQDTSGRVYKPKYQVGDRLYVKEGHIWEDQLWLEVTAVRAEWLQDISEADAKAEGVEFLRDVPDVDETLASKDFFEVLWESIYDNHGKGIYSWGKNPYVWVYTFKVLSTTGKPA